MANIKINNVILNDIDTIKIKNANNDGYVNFTVNNTSVYNTVTYNPVNEVVNNYITEVNYNNLPYNTSSVYSYSHQSTAYRKDTPNGFTENISGVKFILVDSVSNKVLIDNQTTNSYKFVNYTPGTNCGYATILSSNNIAKYINVSTNTAHPLRMINVPSIYNVRDHGGWNCDGGYVKYGLLFRGGAFNSISTNDKKILTDFLGIGCEIDFMFAYQGGQLSESLLGKNVEYVCIPTNASYENLVIPGLYKDGSYITNDTTTDILKPMLEKIFHNVRYNIPTYYHCSLGADRTGTLGFIIDALLGMPQSDVDKEWELTSFAEAEKGSSPRERNSTSSYWRYPDLVYYFIGGPVSRTYTDPDAGTYKENHPTDNYVGFGKNNLRDNVAQWAVDELGLSLSDINAFRRNMIVGNPADINL